MPPILPTLAPRSSDTDIGALHASAWNSAQRDARGPVGHRASRTSGLPAGYGTTVVDSVSVLLAVFVSVVVAVTDAVFWIVVFFDGGVTTIVTVTVPPLAIVPRLHVTIRF